MTANTKRAIAYGSALAVTIAALVAVFIDNRREATGDPRLRQWEKTPVVFGYDPAIEEFAGGLASAIDDLNNAVDCPLATIDSDRPMVRVSWLGTDPCGGEDSTPKDADASYYQCADGTGHIVVRRLFTHTHARVLFRHEIGHVFGLAHDDSGPSVMRSPPGYDDIPAPDWTRKDVLWLRDRYCR